MRSARAGTTGSSGWTPARRPRAAAGILSALLTPSSCSTRPDLVERTLPWAMRPGRPRCGQLVMQATRVDLRPGLAGVTVPSLVVSGADDPICPPVFHTELIEALPGARLETLDAGHLLPMERPAEFGALVRDWVADHVESERLDRRTRCGSRPRFRSGVAAEPADDLGNASGVAGDRDRGIARRCAVVPVPVEEELDPGEVVVLVRLDPVVLGIRRVGQIVGALGEAGDVQLLQRSRLVVRSAHHDARP